MTNTAGNLISIGSLIMGAVTLGVAWSQLRQANDSLRAANTLALAREERDIADRIIDAGSDEVKLNGAYDRYGDHLAYAGYLYDRGQIENEVWLDINSGFCQYLKDNQVFYFWYQRNVTTEHLIKLFPRFSQLGGDCP